MLVIIVLITFVHSALSTCDSGYYYNSALEICMVCPTNCLACCDENICSQCDTGWNSIM